MTKIANTAVALWFCIFVHLSLAGDTPTIIDLKGGYLFDYDDVVDPQDGYPTMTFSVASNEKIILTNGSLIDPRLTAFEDPQIMLDIDGELVFGQDFPMDSPGFLDSFYTVLFWISGSLTITNDTELVMFTRGGPAGDEYFFVDESGSLILDGIGDIQIPGGVCAGTLEIASDKTVTLSGESSFDLGDSGSIILGARSSLINLIVEQGSMHLSADSTISTQALLSRELTLQCGSTINYFGYYCNCSITSDITIDNTDEFFAPTFNFSSLYAPVFRDSTLSLSSTPTNAISEITRIVSISGLGEWVPNTPSEVIFNNPDSTESKSFLLRWGTDGIYVLTTPLDWCEADLDFNGDLDFFDISAFINSYNAESPLANLQNDLVFDFFDVSAFLNAYTNGCN